MFTIKTEDNYTLDVTGDVDILTVDGWKPVELLEVGDIIMENGTNTPPYSQKEVLEMLYVQKGKTQKEIA